MSARGYIAQWEKVAAALDVIVAERGAPLVITVDNGTEFASRAMDLWAYANGVHLDFIRPGRPVENGYIESFNGKLRDECLNVEVFFTLADAREKLALWRLECPANSVPVAVRQSGMEGALNGTRKAAYS